MDCYLYDRDTLELIGTAQADPSPGEPGRMIVPGNATLIAPPALGPNEAAVFDVQTEAWSVVTDWRGTTYWLADGSHHEVGALGVDLPLDALSAEPPLPLAAAAALAKIAIDTAAGTARTAFPSAGALVDAEYYRAEADARTFAAAGYPAGAVPASVQSWASVRGWTAQQAADDIIATADGWYGVLDAIRAARLTGKAAVDEAAAQAQAAIDDALSIDDQAAADVAHRDGITTIDAARDAAITQLNTIRPA